MTEQAMGYNPFYDIAKADAHSPRNVAKLFVRDANPIWNDLQSPVHQFVVGARGTGKTMALRQLDYHTLTSDDQNPCFVGTYIHVSRISTIFHTLFADLDEFVDKNLVQQFQQVFADYLVLEVIRVICELSASHEKLVRPDFSTAINLPRGFNTRDTADECVRLQMHVESSIQSWQISRRCAWRALGDLPTIIMRLAQSLRQSNPWLTADAPCLYVLLDESSPIPHACQRVLNGLLLRGEPYCVKLAIRPFEWHTLYAPSGLAKEPNTDFLALYLEQPDELSPEQTSSMEKIVNKVLSNNGANGTRIRDLIPAGSDYPYSGFNAVSAASSGNPQDLLMMCSAIFAEWGSKDEIDDNHMNPVPPEIQHDVIKKWSSDFVHQNPYEASRRFCQALAYKIKELPDHARSISFEYESDQPKLFSESWLPDDLAKPLRPAFAGGFIRTIQEHPTSLWELPRRFRLSRGALPDLDIAIDTPMDRPVQLDRAFIESKSKASHGFATVQTKSDMVVYLSDSFIKKMDSRREPMEHAFKAAGFSFPTIRQSGKPSPWYVEARRQIAKSDIALVGGCGTPMRTMFEIGLCASENRRRVDVIFGQIGNAPSTKWLEPLPTVSLQVDDGNYRQFAAEIHAKSRQLRAGPNIFAKVALTGVSMRPKQKRTNTIYISLPDNIPLAPIRERLIAYSWSVITEADMNSYAANALQVPVLCAFTARIGVIDTSAQGGLDPMQCYKLGLFAGKRLWKVLHTANSKLNASNPVLVQYI